MSGFSRIQMSRQTPWRAANPDAVIVARPSRWGNPFSAARCYDRRLWAVHSDLSDDAVGPRVFSKLHATELAVLRFAKYARLRLKKEPEWLVELRGHDLACWCKPGHPCHADVLLELANAARP